MRRASPGEDGMISSGEPLTITIEKPRPGTAVLRLTGYCDHETVDGLRRTVAAALLEVSCLTVDFGGVETCDSSGLSALIFTRRRTAECGACLHLTGFSPHLRRIVRTTGLEPLFASALAPPVSVPGDGEGAGPGDDGLLIGGGGPEVRGAPLLPGTD